MLVKFWLPNGRIAPRFVRLDASVGRSLRPSCFSESQAAISNASSSPASAMGIHFAAIFPQYGSNFIMIRSGRML